MPTATHSAASQTASQPTDAVQTNATRIFRQILVAGVLTPILVGVAVIFNLQLSGRPHLEWSELWSVGTLIALLIPVIVSWILFALLAWVARSRILRKGIVDMTVYGAFVGGEVLAIAFCWWGWQHADEVLVVAMFLLWVVMEGMFIAWEIGWGTNIPKPTHSAADQVPPAPADAVQEKAKRIFRQILAAGFLTPILVGIAVNYDLQLSGKPHLEWSELWSVGNLVGLLIPVIVSCVPFALLAWDAKSCVLRTGMVEKSVYGAFAGGEVGTIATFWLGWQHIDALFLFTFCMLPLWVPTAVGMLIGSGIGWLANMLRPVH